MIRARTMIVLGLITGALGACRPSETVMAEVKRRSAFVRELAIRESMADAWSLNSRENIFFQDGISNVGFVDFKNPDTQWFEVTRDPSATRGSPVRWMNRSVHLRVRGDEAMTLAFGGKINVYAVFTRPRLELSLDGVLLTSKVVESDGRFSIEVDVEASAIADWADLYLTWSSLQDPERESGVPRVARLEYVRWEPTKNQRR